MGEETDYGVMTDSIIQEFSSSQGKQSSYDQMKIDENITTDFQIEIKWN